MLKQMKLAVIAAAVAGVLVWPQARPETVKAAQQIELWMAPSSQAVSARARLARAVADLADGRAEDSLPVFIGASGDPLIGSYARLFAARAYLALSKPNDVARTVTSILSASPSDALAEAALNLAVDAGAMASDKRAVFDALKALAARPNSQPAATEFRLLQAAIGLGDRATATASFRRLYFDFAATPETADAIEEMARISIGRPAAAPEDAGRHLGRAEALFTAARYADARVAYVAVQSVAPSESRDLIQLRVAECDLFLKKHAVAAPALRTLADAASPRSSEAEFHYLSAIKGLGRTADYVSLARDLSKRLDAPWAERALNDLGTYFILTDEDEKAADVFGEQYARFPQGAFSDRAAWRAGWWAYKQKQYAETVRIFESAAVSMRRADYRPAWLYWAARGHLELGHRDAALEGFRRTIADYRNSYYGRTAIQEVMRLQPVVRTSRENPVSPARTTWPASIAPAMRPANGAVIEQLLAAGMHEDAIAELRRLQSSGQGSPLIDATLAWALNRQGKLRPAITAMRRAYPQFMAEGGEALPQEILTVIFPIDHWSLLRAQAAAKSLDPYLVAALVAQESTFQADVKSAANAWGLMQIVPATGRRYAATLGIKPFSTFRLVEPDVNVRIGTTFFSDLLKRFGDVGPALAAYNAGPERVVRWLAERPGFSADEFIDDIPFPETQNYVKRIIGTAEDYRILYGGAPR